ncbi:MAG: glutaredoxin family protein [Sarcina sp.]
MIKVYSTDSCPWCVKAKDYLKSKGMEYTDLNVRDDMEAREEMISKTKQMSVPVLDINGNVIIGFDKKAIDEALATLA